MTCVHQPSQSTSYLSIKWPEAELVAVAGQGRYLSINHTPLKNSKIETYTKGSGGTNECWRLCWQFFRFFFMHPLISSKLIALSLHNTRGKIPDKLMTQVEYLFEILARKPSRRNSCRQTLQPRTTGLQLPVKLNEEIGLYPQGCDSNIM